MSRHEHVHPIFVPILEAIYPSTGVNNENVLSSDLSGLRVCGARCEQPRDRDHVHSAPEPQPVRLGCEGADQSAQRELTSPLGPGPLEPDHTVSPSPPSSLGSWADSEAVLPVNDSPDALECAQHHAEVKLLTDREDY